MMTKAKIIDTAKTILIVVLVASAFFLMLKAIDLSPAQLLKSIFDNEPASQDNLSSDRNSVLLPSVPNSVMLTSQDGQHYAVKYDFALKQSIFASYTAELGEALGGATQMESIDTSQWRKALSGTGVFFDYLYPQPLDAIARYLGTEASSVLEDLLVRRLLLSHENKKVVLYFLDEDSGGCYKLGTSMDSGSLDQKIADSDLIQGSFAFESDGGYSELDPYFVFTGENSRVKGIASSAINLPSEKSPIPFDIFTINQRASSQHSESDGTVVYREGTDGAKSLRIGSNGSILFTASGSYGLPVESANESPTLNECLSAAAVIINGTIATQAGSAEIGLIGVENESSGGVTLSYGYFISGIPVRVTNDGWCARIRVSDGKIVRAELIYRQYELLDSDFTFMMESFACHTAQLKGVDTFLAYVDLSNAPSCNWTQK